MNITVERIYVYVCIILKKSHDRRIKKHPFSNPRSEARDELILRKYFS